jgi:hypothetical protein
MTCDYTDRDGAYVLGALSTTERREFEEHLDDCADCTRAVRELAGLPGLLARVDPAVLERPPGEDPLPDTLLPSLLHTVRRTRRRRSFLTGSAAAAAVVALVALAPFVVDRAHDPTDAPSASSTADGTAGVTTTATTGATAGRAMAPLDGAPVSARISLASVAWGTRLDLVCTYAPRHEKYDPPKAVTYGLFVRSRDGHTEQVGTWRSLEDRTMRLTAATATARRDIVSVQVRTADGRPVLELAT